MDNINVCVFCKKVLSVSKTVNVGAKGLQSIILASKQKGDKILEELKTATNIKVHESCRKKYVRKEYIKKNLPLPIDESKNKQTLRSSVKDFDFKTNCLICGESICLEKEKKKPKEYRQEIRIITEVNMKEKLVKICESRMDNLGRQIVIRLSNIIDLVAAEGNII